MPKTIAILRHPLDGVFAASSHIAVLRTLLDSREGMSGRSIARVAGINPQTCVNALRNLETLDLIHRQGSGHTQLIKLNRDNYFVKELLLPLLSREREVPDVIRGDIDRGIRPYAKTATLFGSRARKEHRPESDLDLFVTVESAREKNALESQLLEFQSTFKTKFGLRLAPIIMTVQETRARIKKNDALVGNILRDGIDLLPRKLNEVVG